MTNFYTITLRTREKHSIIRQLTATNERLMFQAKDALMKEMARWETTGGKFSNEALEVHVEWERIY